MLNDVMLLKSELTTHCILHSKVFFLIDDHFPQTVNLARPFYVIKIESHFRQWRVCSAKTDSR